MARNKKPLPRLEGVTIERIAAEGRCIAHHGELVVFVPFAAPGDVCTLQLFKKRKRAAEARILAIETSSSVRRLPICSHFAVCGGCKWQHIYYQTQLEAKAQQVRDAMERIAKIDVGEYRSIIGGDEEYRYRNKVEFTFSNRRWLMEEEIADASEEFLPAERYGLGFHIPGKFDKVLDIEECFLASRLTDEIRNYVRQFSLANPEQYSYFDLREQTGVLRTMMVRTSTTGEVMLLLAFAEDNKESREALLSAIKGRFPEITSLLYVINQKRNDTFNDLDVHCFAGRDYITETIEELRFKIGAKSFFQTNTAQARKLYAVTRALAGLTGTETVYDLYTGTGTIANYVARHAWKVIGVEYVPEAIEDAVENSCLNGIDNTLFFAGDMKDILTESFIAEHGRPDVIITDPPRAGMHEDVVKTIISAAPRRIVYVSCNPATQARDAALLIEGGYRALVAQPVDLFPQTHHVENVMLFEK